VTAITCPNCGEPAPAGAKWCEACGADLDLTPAVACVDCGALDISADGYCMACGRKQPNERDHVEVQSVGPVSEKQPAGVAAAVTDRGVRHHENEDAVAVAGLSNGSAVLVVCDGVSSTPGSAEASSRAAEAACELLVDRCSELSGGEASARTVGLETVAGWLTEAAAVAQAEAAAAPEVKATRPNAQGGPPSSTFVAALGLASGLSDGASGSGAPAEGEMAIVAAWLGDSRAYWLPAAGPGQAELLTVDHEIGGSLSRWLGADAPTGPVDVVSKSVTGPGWLLVCSDGLWRYANSPTEMWQLVERVDSSHLAGEWPDQLAARSARALHLAKGLVAHAVEAGGHDNISAALWPAISTTAAGNQRGESDDSITEQSTQTQPTQAQPTQAQSGGT